VEIPGTAHALGRRNPREVAQCGRGESIARRATDLQRSGGFGLNVVEILSRRWGVHSAVGARVWAETAFPAAG